MKQGMLKLRKYGIRVLVILGWILVWWAVSYFYRKPILLPGPMETLQALGTMIVKLDTWRAIGTSLGRILMGFGLALILGSGLGCLSEGWKPAAIILSPVVRFAKSVPVAAFVVLALLWFGADWLSVAIAFLIAFPILYTNTMAGIRQRDSLKLEMAKILPIPLIKRIRYIDLETVGPALLAGCKSAYGMCWKAAVAAEIIGIAAGTIGEQLYMAKIYIETADLFAWIILIVAASSVSEKVVLLLLGLILEGKGGADRPKADIL